MITAKDWLVFETTQNHGRNIDKISKLTGLEPLFVKRTISKLSKKGLYPVESEQENIHNQIGNSRRVISLSSIPEIEANEPDEYSLLDEDDNKIDLDDPVLR